MSILPVQLKVLTTCQTEGHTIDEGEYAGVVIERPSVNHPGGKLKTYRLNPNAFESEDVDLILKGTLLDVTTFVEDGSITAH